MARALHAAPAVAPVPIGADAPLASIALVGLGVVFHLGGSLLLLLKAPPLAALHAFAAFVVLAVVAAIHQLLPVLLGVSPLSWKLTLGAGLGFASGFGLLIAGFFGEPTFAAAAALLALTAAIWCAGVATRIVAARLERFTAAAIGTAVCAFGVAAGIGAAMAYGLSRGGAFAWQLPGIHGSLMVLLFASLLIVALSYRFVPMFALSHANAYGKRRLLLAAIAVLLAASLMSDRRPAFAAAAVLLAILGFEHLQTLRGRMRARIDTSLIYAASAWALALVATIASAVFGLTPATAAALIALTVLGWLSITIWGYAMKILGFLSWQFARSRAPGTPLAPLRDAIPTALAGWALAALAIGALAVALANVEGFEALGGPAAALYAAGSALSAIVLARIALPYLRHAR